MQPARRGATLLRGLAASAGIWASIAAVTASAQLDRPSPQPVAQFDAGTIRVSQYGSGNPALIFIPGLANSAAVWNDAIAHYAPSHTIYAVTLAGFGGVKPAQPPLMEKAEDDILALIQQKHLDRPVLIGHSLGGTIAIRIAERQSSLLRGVVAVDGMPVLPGLEQLSEAQRTQTIAFITGQIKADTADEFNTMERNVILPAMITDPANVSIVAGDVATADRSSFATYLQEDMSADFRSQLSSITIPLLEIAPFDAAADPKNPPYFAADSQKKAYYAGLLAGDHSAQVVMIDPSRHFIMLDQPQKFYDAVDAFLHSLP
ncbi:MAG: alpha/beta hydrolase [Candidatus Eremiobacteraeota bacterium]|nr:alpha/beta hydrolase [Candidatus Eremiobacteraeota bacterium]